MEIHADCLNMEVKEEPMEDQACSILLPSSSQHTTREDSFSDVAEVKKEDVSVKDEPLENQDDLSASTTTFCPEIGSRPRGSRLFKCRGCQLLCASEAELRECMRSHVKGHVSFLSSTDDSDRVCVTPPPAKKARGGPRDQQWNERQVEVLLGHIRDNFTRLTGKSERRSKVFGDIARLMQEEFPGVTRSQVEQKWRNLKQQYMKYQTARKSTGTARRPEPRHFDLISSFMAERDIVKARTTSIGIPISVLNEIQQVPHITSDPENVGRVCTDAAAPTTFPLAYGDSMPSTSAQQPPIAVPVVIHGPVASPEREVKEPVHHAIGTCEETPGGQFLRTRRRSVRPETVRESLSKNVKCLTERLDKFMDFIENKENSAAQYWENKNEYMRQKEMRDQEKHERLQALRVLQLQTMQRNNTEKS